MAKIVRLAGVQPGDRVLEIGPGQGDLTASLLGAGASVLAVEIDSRLIAALRTRCEGLGTFDLLEADALSGKHALDPVMSSKLASWGPYLLVSNLPYAAGTPLLVNLLTGSHPPSRSVVMLQHEVAARLAALPGSKAYGALTVQMASVARTRILQKVPPSCFTPPPKVESALVELVATPHQADPAALRALLTHLFGQRRKSIGKRLAGLGLRAEDFGVDPRARAEELDSHIFIAMARSCPSLLTPPLKASPEGE